MARRRWGAWVPTVALLIAVAPALWTGADTLIVREVVYEWKRGVQTQQQTNDKMWLGNTRARLEQQNELFLLDALEGTLIYLDLDKDHYVVHPSPNTLEATIPAQVLERAKTQWGEYQPQRIEVRRTGKKERIAGHDTELVVIEAGGPGEPLTARFELWISEELGEKLESTAYWDFYRDRMYISPYTSWLVDPMRELRGYPVRLVAQFALEDGAMRTDFTSTLVSWEEGVEPPRALYEVPEGYARMEDPSMARP